MSEEFQIKDANEALRHGWDALRAGGDAWNKSRQPSWRDHTISAYDLEERIYPPIRYVIPGIIPEGTSLLVGRPKVGKSWLALDLALSVASGTPCLGGRIPESGDVLYCALEDNERRLKSRITKLRRDVEAPWPRRLTLSTKWARLNKGGSRDIKDWADGVEQPRLVILDTLASIRPVDTREGYAADYEALTEVHRLANDRGIAVLVLHHQRKVDAEDPLDTISGTLGLAGCVDTPIILASGKNGKTLYVRGRDVEEAEYAVEFDKLACRWKILGSADDVHRSETRQKIIAALKKAGALMSPSDLAEATGLSPQVIKVRLSGMLNDGEVAKAGRGQYALPDFQQP
jgi:hypothetical protein